MTCVHSGCRADGVGSGRKHPCVSSHACTRCPSHWGGRSGPWGPRGVGARMTRPLPLATSPARALPSQERSPQLSIMPLAWRVPGNRGAVLRPAPRWAGASAHPLLPRYLVLQLGGGGLLVAVSEGQPLPQGCQLLLQLGLVLLQPGHGLHHPMHHGGRTWRPRQARAPPAAKEPPTYEQSSGRSAGQQRSSLAEERGPSCRADRAVAPSGTGGNAGGGDGAGRGLGSSVGQRGDSGVCLRGSHFSGQLPGGTELPGSGLGKATFPEDSLQSMGSSSNGRRLRKMCKFSGSSWEGVGLPPRKTLFLGQRAFLFKPQTLCRGRKRVGGPLRREWSPAHGEGGEGKVCVCQEQTDRDAETDRHGTWTGGTQTGCSGADPCPARD